MARSFRLAAPADTEPFSAINVTPVIDVMLVLMIMVILSVPAMNHKISLPLPFETPGPAMAPTIEHLRIDAQGALSWNGAAIQEGALPARLATMQRNPNATLALAADAETRYERYDQVLAVVKRSGIERLALSGNREFASQLER